MTEISGSFASVPNLPIVDSIQLDTLLPLPSQSPQFSLHTDNKRINKIEAYQVLVQKEKLAHYLQIYEWRRKT